MQLLNSFKFHLKIKFSLTKAFLSKNRSKSSLIFHFPSYIDSIIKYLKPPVANKLIYSNDLQAMIVAGPNKRNDFHIEEGEVIFIKLLKSRYFII